MIKLTRKQNLSFNSSLKDVPEFGKMINGQALGAAASFRYGICPMSFNGCEVIAVHNALVHLGIPQKLADISFYMERFRMLMGFFGCNAYKIGKALAHFGGGTGKRLRNADGLDAFIITFWTKKPFLSSVHTVFCLRRKHDTEVYNCFNSCRDVKVYRDISDFAGKRKPIAVYAVSLDK